MPTAAAYYDQAGRVRAGSWMPPYNLACLRATNGAGESRGREVPIRRLEAFVRDEDVGDDHESR